MSGNRIHPIHVCVAVLALNCVTHAAEFAGGSGIATDPYQIATADQLLQIGEEPDLFDKHFQLVADIDLDPNLPGRGAHDEVIIKLFTWGTCRDIRPCKVAVPFSGFFDGNQHVIRNFVIRKHDSTSHAGVFDSIGEQGMVCDLRLERIHIVDVNNAAQASPYCGGLAGENRGRIVGCSVDGGIDCGAGLVGTNSGMILYSYASGMARGGGLVRGNSGIIRASCATANVSASPDSDTSTTSFAGGLVGINSGTISDCYATGAVPAYEYSTCHSGGLVGRNNAGASGGVLRCYASGGGGLALVAKGDALNSYFLRASDGGGTDSGYGIGLTDAQMRRQGSFVGWDFVGDMWDGSEEVWMMPADGGYPVLRGIETPAFAGSGTADDPYIIEARYQFLDLWRRPRAHFRLIADIDMRGQSFTSPIFPTFWGHMDGAGHTIGNFTLAGEKGLGLFGVLSPEASINDLSLGGVHITMVAGSTSPQPLIESSGALAACNRGKVLHCSASTEITCLIGSAKYVGGLIGANEWGEVRECSARCAVWHGTARKVRAAEFCGGLVGLNTGTVAACHASSYISGDFVAFGALVGDNDGRVDDCYADGHLYSYHYAGSFTGGLVGDNSGRVANCYASTVVASPPASGGLVGRDSRGTVASSYFLSAADDGGPDNGLGVALTDMQMRRRASFIGWDFESIWTMLEGEDYPRLWWEAGE